LIGLALQDAEMNLSMFRMLKLKREKEDLCWDWCISLAIKCQWNECAQVDNWWVKGVEEGGRWL
jgi:hypothetical protein